MAPHTSHADPGSRSANSFATLCDVDLAGRSRTIHSLRRAAESLPGVDQLPFTLKVVLENLLRHEDGVTVTTDDVRALLSGEPDNREIALHPTRILMQDFTGVPAIADLSALRDAVVERGGDVTTVRPQIPVDLVVDHSITAEVTRTPDARRRNEELERARNGERYEFLELGRATLPGLQVYPPGIGICHQVNLERLARVVEPDVGGLVCPDSLVGTDSHTTMINGLGVLGWGVGGIEAEAAMLGEPVPIGLPDVLGVQLRGSLRPGVTATDLVLTITERLRQHGVVGRFVEFHGPGVAAVTAEARATIANMSPEYGSTAVMFPIDEATIAYLRRTGRPEEHLELVEAYAREQGLWGNESARYRESIDLDLDEVEPTLAGPSLPQQRVPLHALRERFRTALDASLSPDARSNRADEGALLSFPASDPPAVDGPVEGAVDPDSSSGADRTGAPPASNDTSARLRRDSRPVQLTDGPSVELTHGDVVIAAITSCTNTSNPSVMVAAGLVARNAVRAGLTTRPWVKTSLAPGSQSVMSYLHEAELVEPLEALGFALVGYGCTTCIGNSGALDPAISRAINDGGLEVAAVLSGNRNFEGRIHPDVRMNFLASPPLVVAAALAGTVDVDLTSEPIATGPDGGPVMLADLWPSDAEVAEVVDRHVGPRHFQVVSEPPAERPDAAGPDSDSPDTDSRDHDSPDNEREQPAAGPWREGSTYVRRPPFLDDPQPVPERIEGARVLVWLGDSVTTDHISPAGAIGAQTPAGAWLIEHGVDPSEFNSYGSRRGNHEVMIRGTFANPRLRNRLAPGTEGGWTRRLPDDEIVSVFDAAVQHREDGTPLLVVAGREYGTGSSRDWAAKGAALLGVRAVLAESFERIHRSNLVGMGVLPLQFPPGTTAESLGLDPTAPIDLLDIDLTGASRTVQVRQGDTSFEVRLRADSPRELEYLRRGGILPYVLDRLVPAGSQEGTG